MNSSTLYPLKNMSDLIVSYLKQIKSEFVFGIPGGHITALYESLEKSEKDGGPKAILTRHESGAAFMAAGYAKETGKIGVCCATAGPGTTNIITGVASAYADHVPMLVITGQTALPTGGMGGLQESMPHQGHFPDIVDTVGMLGHCTRYNTLITHPHQLERKLAAALITSMQHPQGPVHISLPVDILNAPAPESSKYPDLSRLLESSSFVDSTALEKLKGIISETMAQGRKIALFIGHECAGAADEIIKFAETTESPMVTSLRGKSIIRPYHPLYHGVFGAFGHQSARRALEDKSVALILAVGVSLGQWGSSGWSKLLLNPKMVHIHTASVYFARSPMARLHLYGVAKTVFTKLNRWLAAIKPDKKFPLNSPGQADGGRRLSGNAPPGIELEQPNAYKDDSSPIKPQRLIYELARNLPDRTRFIIDTGNILAWTIHYLFNARPEHYRLLSIGQPCTGWAIGGAIGTAISTAPGVPVVCMTGDGSFLMYGQEITVAVERRLPVIFVILNDQSYGMIKHRSRQTATKPLEFAIPLTDFSLMAKAVGADGYIIQDCDDFKKLDYEKMRHGSRPTVLDVRIDPEEPPPLRMV